MGLKQSTYGSVKPYKRLEMDTKLIQSCKIGDTRLLQTMLKRGVPPDTRDSNHRRMTALMCLPYTCLPNMKTKRRCRGSLNKQIRTVELLLHYGANLTLADAYGKTALHHFAGGCLLQALECILKTGVNVDIIVPTTGNSPLHYACLAAVSKRAKIVQQFLEYHADPNIQNHRKDTALHLAVRRKHKDTVDILMKNPSINLNLLNIDGETVLHLCCQKSISINNSEYYGRHDEWNVNMAEGILQHGIDVNLKDRYNRPALYLCFASLYHPYSRCLSKMSEPERNISSYPCLNSDKSALQVLKLLLENPKTDPNILCGIQNDTLLAEIYKSGCPVNKSDISMLQIGLNPRIKNTSGMLGVDYLLQRWKHANYNQTDWRNYVAERLILHIQAGLTLEEVDQPTLEQMLFNFNDNKLFQFMYLSGYNLFRYKSTSRVNNMEFGNIVENLEWNNVLPLKQITANVIRSNLYPNAIVSISRIGIPKLLQSYITFDYIIIDIHF